MSDGASLLLILVLLYLSDCVCFVNRHAVAFVRPFRTWRIRLAGLRFSANSGSLVGLNPLPPLGTVFRVRLWPLSLSNDGACAFVGSTLSPAGRPPQAAAAVAYADMVEVGSDGATIRVNGNAFAAADTREPAEALSSLLNRLHTAPAAARSDLLDQAIAASLDVRAAAAEAMRFRADTRVLRVLCVAFWLYLFVLCPALTTAFGLQWLLIPLALAGLLFHVSTVIVFFRTHRRLLPDERSSRLEHVFKMALCPPMAVRAVDAVTAHALARFHPIAVAFALAPPAEAAAFTGLYLRDLRHPMPTALDGAAAEIESDYRQRLIVCVERLLGARGVDVRTLVAPPQSTDVGDRAYCPRCLGLFTVEGGICPDCVGIHLTPIAHAQTGGTTP
jgi:hypothetical protein